MVLDYGTLIRVATVTAMILGSAVTDEDLEFLQSLNDWEGFSQEAMPEIHERVKSYLSVRKV